MKILLKVVLIKNQHIDKPLKYRTTVPRFRRPTVVERAKREVALYERSLYDII